MDLTHWLHSSIIAPLFPAIIDEVINIEAVEDSKPEHSDPKFRTLFGNCWGKSRTFFAFYTLYGLKMSDSCMTHFTKIMFRYQVTKLPKL